MVSTIIPLSANILAPATNGFGSKEPITTFLILCSIIKSVQAGVLPICEQGSKVTYKVASDKLGCFNNAAWIAITSACASPAF